MMKVASKNGRTVHLVAEFKTQAEVAEWARDSFPQGALVTACGLSLKAENETDARFTCGRCLKVLGFTKEDGDDVHGDHIKGRAVPLPTPVLKP